MTELLLIHAFPVNKGVWEPVRAQLRSRGIAASTIDLFGFGDRACERPAADSGLDALGDQVAQWIKRSGEPIVLGGLSLGGYVAMNVVRRYPDLVSGLVLADTKATADDESGRDTRLAFAQRAEDAGNGWVAEAMMPKLVGETTRAQRPEVAAAVTEMIAASPGESIAWVQRAMAQRPDSQQVLRDFDGPALVIVGEQDAISTLSECRAMAEMLSDPTLSVIPDAGHLSPIEDPAAVSDAVAGWWERHFG